MYLRERNFVITLKWLTLTPYSQKETNELLKNDLKTLSYFLFFQVKEVLKCNSDLLKPTATCVSVKETNITYFNLHDDFNFKMNGDDFNTLIYIGSAAKIFEANFTRQNKRAFRINQQKPYPC